MAKAGIMVNRRRVGGKWDRQKLVEKREIKIGSDGGKMGRERGEGETVRGTSLRYGQREARETNERKPHG